MAGIRKRREQPVWLECGEDANDQLTWEMITPPERRERLQDLICADVARALMHAYYRYVCKADTVHLDLDRVEWVASAIGPDRYWMADFSTYYEIPLQTEPATVNQLMLWRAESAADENHFSWRLRGDGRRRDRQAIYEVWCFLPPSPGLLDALQVTRAAGLQVTLVTPDELNERIRKTVLAAPADAEEHAFAGPAALIRTAFGL